MKNSGEESVRILSIVANASRRSSIAQLTRLQQDVQNRFRTLLVSQRILEDNEDESSDIDQINATTNLIQAHLNSVNKIEEIIKSQAKKHLNYEGAEDTEKLKQNLFSLHKDLRERQKRYKIASQQLAEAEDFVIRLRDSVQVFETKIMARKTQLMALKEQNKTAEKMLATAAARHVFLNKD